MRAGSRVLSLVLAVCFAAVMPDMTAREVTGGRSAGAGPELDAVSARSPAPLVSSVVRIRMRENGRVLVPVVVNNSGTYLFLLDTGSAMTMLNRRLAKRLGVAATKGEWVHTFAGRVSLPGGRADSLKIGTFEIHGSDILIGDLGRLFNHTPEVDGILGQDILSRFNYLIDRRAGILEIEEGNNLRSTLAGTKVSFEKQRGVIYVPAARGALLLILDSGNPYLVIYEDAARRCDAVLTISGGEGAVESSLGRRAVRPTRLPSLEIGDNVLHNVGALLATRESGCLEDGFLPLHIFDSIYVNNLESFLIANPRRN